MSENIYFYISSCPTCSNTRGWVTEEKQDEALGGTYISPNAFVSFPNPKTKKRKTSRYTNFRQDCFTCADDVFYVLLNLCCNKDMHMYTKKTQQPISPAGKPDPCPNITQRFGLISIAEMAATSGTNEYGNKGMWL